MGFTFCDNWDLKNMPWGMMQFFILGNSGRHHPFWRRYFGKSLSFDTKSLTKTQLPNNISSLNG